MIFVRPEVCETRANSEQEGARPREIVSRTAPWGWAGERETRANSEPEGSPGMGRGVGDPGK